MYGVELYAAVRLAVAEEGLSHREAARRFGIDRRTEKKMLSYSAPPRRRGYRGRCSTRQCCNTFLASREASSRASFAVSARTRSIASCDNAPCGDRLTKASMPVTKDWCSAVFNAWSSSACTHSAHAFSGHMRPGRRGAGCGDDGGERERADSGHWRSPLRVVAARRAGTFLRRRYQRGCTPTKISSKSRTSPSNCEPDRRSWRGLDVAVAEQFAGHRQGPPERQRPGRESVAEVLGEVWRQGSAT